jgi:predicted nucleotidyltransferase
MKFIRIKPDLIKENVAPIAPIQQLDEIDALADTIDDNMGKEVHVPKDVLDSFKIKNTLNPEIWPEGELNPKVQKNLIKIANGFIKDINLPKGIKIKDIIFTGSLANYNWSKFSDIDLHIITDFKQLESDKQLTKDYFWAKKNLWNQEHDITVFGYPVELYVQDISDKLVATAIYSIQNDKWIKKPIREKFKLDKQTIKNKTQEFIDQLKDIRKDYKEEDYQTVVDKTKKLKDKIKQMRKAGLESGGEFSNENIVFKVLRRTSFMDVLDSFKNKAYDNIMSVAENLKENISTPEEKIILKYNIGRDSRVQFKNDPKIYYVKNVATDKKSLFVTLNGQQTYNKKIKNLIKIGNSDVSI